MFINISVLVCYYIFVLSLLLLLLLLLFWLLLLALLLLILLLSPSLCFYCSYCYRYLLPVLLLGLLLCYCHD